ncbi:MAG: hypothetical protein ACRDA5_04645 [Clostridium sp.]
MNIKIMRSDEVYRKMMNSPRERRDDIYRYEMIKYYLKKTGKSIIEVTLTPASDIIKEIEGFWSEQSAWKIS